MRTGWPNAWWGPATPGLSPHDGGTSAGAADTAPLHRIRTDTLEHRSLLQHIWDDHESYHITANIHTIQVRLLAIACGDGDILHRDIEIVFGIE